MDHLNNYNNKRLRILMANLALGINDINKIARLPIAYITSWVNGESLMPPYSMRLVESYVWNYLCNKPVGLRARKTYRRLQMEGVTWKFKVVKNGRVRKVCAAV